MAYIFANNTNVFDLGKAEVLVDGLQHDTSTLLLQFSMFDALSLPFHVSIMRISAGSTFRTL